MEVLQQLVNALTQGCIYALIALGYTMVYGVLRLINFAHGDVYMLGMYFGLFAAGAVGVNKLDAGAPVPIWMIAAVFGLSMLGCALVGLLIERLAYRPLRSAPRLTALITAIGISLLIEYGGQMFFSPNPQGFPPLLGNENIVSGSGLSITSTKVFIVVAAVGLMCGLQLLVSRTRIGRAMRAVSLDRPAASLMGINTDVVIAFTFALGAGLAAAAGVLNGLDQPAFSPLIGVNTGLRAFVAAVLGGIGNIPGAVLGGLIMAFAETAAVMAGLSQFRDAVAFGILILVLIVRPAGLLGRSVAEKV